MPSSAPEALGLSADELVDPGTRSSLPPVAPSDTLREFKVAQKREKLLQDRLKYEYVVTGAMHSHTLLCLDCSPAFFFCYAKGLASEEGVGKEKELGDQCRAQERIDR